MADLMCENGVTCPYGPIDEDDAGTPITQPAKAYSQNGYPMYAGLCLNCLDDQRVDAEHGDYD